MYRQASRSLLRSAHLNLRNVQPSSRRLLSTAPPHEKSRSWKNSAFRWGVAIAGIYYYNTSPIFAENTQRIMKFDTDPNKSIEENLTTLDSYSASRKEQQETVTTSAEPAADAITSDDPAALEEEADSQGAFNPVTGEINWDCPCLGGMAHGPCGEEFRNAFSCFVYSEQEPKGLDCIDKFKSMQDCFRAHPDVYAAELEEDEAELDAELAKEREALNKEAASPGDEPTQKRLLDDEGPSVLPISPILSADAPPAKREPTSAPSSKSSPQQQAPPPESTPSQDTTSVEQSAGKFDEDLELMPKAWHDQTSANEKTVGEKKSKD